MTGLLLGGNHFTIWAAGRKAMNLATGAAGSAWERSRGAHGFILIHVGFMYINPPWFY